MMLFFEETGQWWFANRNHLACLNNSATMGKNNSNGASSYSVSNNNSVSSSSSVNNTNSGTSNIDCSSNRCNIDNSHYFILSTRAQARRLLLS